MRITRTFNGKSQTASKWGRAGRDCHQNVAQMRVLNLWTIVTGCCSA